jgi:hypothetical protein
MGAWRTEMGLLTVRGLSPGTGNVLSSSRGAWSLPNNESGLPVTRVAQSSGTSAERNFMPALWEDEGFEGKVCYPAVPFAEMLYVIWWCVWKKQMM